MLAFFRRQNGRAFFPPLPIAALLPHSWRRAHLNSASWDASTKTGHFYNAKGQREIQSTLAFSASHEARRRMAVFPNTSNMKLHQTGEPWHLSCHGGKTPANLLSLEYPRALWARCGVQGGERKAPCKRHYTATLPGAVFCQEA